MALNAAKAAGGTAPRAEPLAPENYMARVVQVIDLGVQKQRPYMGQEKPPIQMIRITYELGTEFMKDEEGNPDETKPRWISESIPLYNLKAEKAKSTKRYMALDPEVQHQGDFTQLVGAPCLVAIVNNERDGTVYNNVGSVSQPIKGVPVPELVNPSTVFDLDSPDVQVFNSFPDWLQEKIKEGLNFPASKLAIALGGPQPTTVTEDQSAEDDVTVHSGIAGLEQDSFPV